MIPKVLFRARSGNIFFNQNVLGSCPNRTFGIMPKVILNLYFKNDFGHDPESFFFGHDPETFLID